MKAILFAALLVASPMVLAEDLRVKVQDFSFKYDDPIGAGEAALFQHNQKTLQGVRVDVEKIEEALNFKVSGSEEHEFNLEKAPDVVMKAKSILVDDLDLSYEDSLSFSVLRGEFSGEDELQLKNFNLQCARNLLTTKAEDQIITGCIQRMSLKANSFMQSSTKSGVVEALTKVLSKVSESRGNLSVKSLDFKINSGKFDLSAEVKAQISGKAKSNGSISYDETNRVVTIKISEVKFGILSVTGMVFDELKKSESDSIKVKKPYVYITVK